MKLAAFSSLLSATILLSCLQTRAQTSATPNGSRSDAVISVQELAMPAKARRAFEKGTRLLLKGDATASVPCFTAAVELAPSSFRGYHNRGLAYYQLGLLDVAAVDFQKSIDLSRSTFAPSLFGLSMILYQRAQFAEAELLVRKGLFLNSGSALGKYCLGLIQYSFGQIPEALQSALDALNGDPAFADVHVLLAEIHERQHNPSAVVADAEAYLKLDPRGALQDEARRLLARAHQDLSTISTSLN